MSARKRGLRTDRDTTRRILTLDSEGLLFEGEEQLSAEERRCLANAILDGIKVEISDEDAEDGVVRCPRCGMIGDQDGEAWRCTTDDCANFCSIFYLENA